MNQLALSARIAETSALRYTPAGLPAVDLKLEHESQASEAGQSRQVNLAIKAVAFGTMAEALAAQALGTQWRFNGFLATPRNGKYPVLHIQSFVQDTTS
ncbi:primosomal replication protein N [Ramlibacter solisilvae]|uniref:Replication restart protein PriB n=1 Tax=Ramlibacter tataouinensis TaxID=94132 RepID=A0A127JXM1_9BURK|nr:primosomal replication protein N [Ramlibacter tataouinensis]AMO24748.1 single-stranded DNA-binding protein [Ramlibacter tataouinensis]